MARKKAKADDAGHALQEALEAAGVDATVVTCDMGANYLRCDIGGVYDAIQRQGRSDEELIALAVEGYRKTMERRGRL